VKSNFSSVYVHAENRDNGNKESSTSTEFAAYEHFLRNELPSRVREEVIVAVERELEPVEERLRIQLPGIVSIVHRELFQFFQQSRQSTQHSDAVDLPQNSLESAPGTQSQVPFGDLALQLLAADDQLGTIWDPSFCSTSFANFDEPFSLPEPTFPNNEDGWSDPGYGTMPHSATAAESGIPSKGQHDTIANLAQKTKASVATGSGPSGF